MLILLSESPRRDSRRTESRRLGGESGSSSDSRREADGAEQGLFWPRASCASTLSARSSAFPRAALSLSRSRRSRAMAAACSLSLLWAAARRDTSRACAASASRWACASRWTRASARRPTSASHCPAASTDPPASSAAALRSWPRRQSTSRSPALDSRPPSAETTWHIRSRRRFRSTAAPRRAPVSPPLGSPGSVWKNGVLRGALPRGDTIRSSRRSRPSLSSRRRPRTSLRMPRAVSADAGFVGKTRTVCLPPCCSRGEDGSGTTPSTGAAMLPECGSRQGSSALREARSSRVSRGGVAALKERGSLQGRSALREARRPCDGVVAWTTPGLDVPTCSRRSALKEAHAPGRRGW
mmetsp:Transcript_35362/g.99331  ORF Transcript_35362/g.99331 Transcript_35362/m.99331 type:complete len:354 (+) Transcript_35362:516-1577(+)